VSLNQLLLHLFARPDYNHYLFGDYYDPEHASRGIHPMVGGGGERYDPLSTYYQWHSRKNDQGDFDERLVKWRDAVVARELLRPPKTFIAQQVAEAETEPPSGSSLIGRIFLERAKSPGYLRLSSTQRNSIAEAARKTQDLAGARREMESKTSGSLVLPPVNEQQITGATAATGSQSQPSGRDPNANQQLPDSGRFPPGFERIPGGRNSIPNNIPNNIPNIPNVPRNPFRGGRPF
ncbi:MAG: hypothetical protein N2C14_14990, partial [Planctomycetales bacterium]